MTSVGPFFACLVALILFVKGIKHLIRKDLSGNRWKQGSFFIVGGTLIPLLLAAFFWGDQSHWHHDSEGSCDDRWQNEK